MLEDQPYKTRRTIYLSEQTNPDDAAAEPPKLLVCEADLLKKRVASSEVVTTWTELGRCPYIQDLKTIIHPGEVNKIRELPQHPTMVVTHTDAPELYVWNTQTQPNMTRDKSTGTWGESVPDMTLVGHEDQAQFPLATSSSRPMVASGGTDKLVLLWDLTDATKEGGILGHKQQQEGDEQDIERAPLRTTKLQPRHRLVGHADTVEDVVFQPGSANHLASVGDDKQVLFWDTSAGSRPVASIKAAHGSGPDVHCVDWSGLQEYLLVTGAADGSLKVWDRRKLPANGAAAVASTAAVHSFTFHKDAIMRVEWHASAPGVLASGGEDNLVAVWSLDRAAGATAAAAAGSSRAAANGSSSKAGSSSGSSKEAPPELLFKHVGHKGGKVVDFQWCPDDPWLIMSVSENTAREGSEDEDEQDGSESEAYGRKGGGALQIWRINDLLYMPEQEALAELEAHREWILHGRQPPQLAHVQQQLRIKQEQQDGDGAASGGAGGSGNSEGGKQQQESQPPEAAAAGDADEEDEDGNEQAAAEGDVEMADA